MKRVIYISKISGFVSNIHINNLLFASRKNNIKNKISGFILLQHNFFLQWIEGSDEEINKLIKKIKADPRHYDVKILKEEKIVDYSYINWGMIFLFNVDIVSKDDLLILHASNDSNFVNSILGSIESHTLEFKKI